MKRIWETLYYFKNKKINNIEWNLLAQSFDADNVCDSGVLRQRLSPVAVWPFDGILG